MQFTFYRALLQSIALANRNQRIQILINITVLIMISMDNKEIILNILLVLR